MVTNSKYLNQQIYIKTLCWWEYFGKENLCEKDDIKIP